MDENLVSLSQLAIELGVNKSKLNYYMINGLITPISVLGKMCVFNKEETMNILKEVTKSKKKGKTLKQIKEELE